MSNNTEFNRERRLRNKFRAIEKLGSCCSRCMVHYKDMDVYDFHHVGEEKKLNKLGVMWSYSWKRIKEELSKCVLLCANCHRIIHKEERDD